MTVRKDARQAIGYRDVDGLVNMFLVFASGTLTIILSADPQGVDTLIFVLYLPY